MNTSLGNAETNRKITLRMSAVSFSSLGMHKMKCLGDMCSLAGAPGFEPGNADTKNRCLTTWRRPNSEAVE